MNPWIIIPIAIGGMIVGIGLGLLVDRFQHHSITIPPSARVTLPAKGTTNPVKEEGFLPANLRCCCGRGTNCIHF